MVIKRQWKLVSGGVVAAVTLGGGAALAQGGSDAQELPKLQDVVNVNEITVPSTDLTGVSDDVLLQITADESPFSALSASPESLSEPSMSEPSEPSESMSEESVSEDSVSEESVSVESMSVESLSEPSPESMSVPSAESDD